MTIVQPASGTVHSVTCFSGHNLSRGDETLGRKKKKKEMLKRKKTEKKER